MSAKILTGSSVRERSLITEKISPGFSGTPSISPASAENLPVGEISRIADLRRTAIFSSGAFREERETAGVGQLRA
jgi:hypothetical protein